MHANGRPPALRVKIWILQLWGPRATLLWLQRRFPRAAALCAWWWHRLNRLLPQHVQWQRRCLHHMVSGGHRHVRQCQLSARCHRRPWLPSNAWRSRHPRHAARWHRHRHCRRQSGGQPSGLHLRRLSLSSSLRWPRSFCHAPSSSRHLHRRGQSVRWLSGRRRQRPPPPRSTRRPICPCHAESGRRPRHRRRPSGHELRGRHRRRPPLPGSPRRPRCATRTASSCKWQPASGCRHRQSSSQRPPPSSRPPQRPRRAASSHRPPRPACRGSASAAGLAARLLPPQLLIRAMAKRRMQAPRAELLGGS
mmetsp:Transcript_103205/g.301009  ORF Transcript_103205/g.301009 Transcript_103205/m.301009 type:complete len:307 (-) Transcript_103205:334-1254(-)